MEYPRQENLLIREIKAHYMLWPGIKYPMFSFQSKSDFLNFVPNVFTLEIYIVQIKFNRQESPRESNVFRDLKTLYMLSPGIK
jgi:hypothetical protein